jgi:hypothetical protein
MPDNPNPPQQPPSPGQQQGSGPAPEYVRGHIPMTEEFDRAKWTLPPAVPLVIAAVVVAIVIAVVAFTTRQKPVMSGAITKVATVDQQGNTMVAVQVKLNNVVNSQLWVKNIDLHLETADGKKFTDHAAPSGDAESYLKAFPPLQEASADPLHEELKIPPRTAYTGMAVFSFPVDQKTFEGRKSLSLQIQIYDQPTLVLKNP